SISGLHVTMVAGLLGGLAGGLWRRWPGACLRWPAQRVAVLAACLAAAGYVLLAGFAIPAQRTLYMLLVAALAQALNRRLAPSRTLALALLAVLLIDPWAVLAAGFWLSFAAVGALLYVGSAQVGGLAGWRGQVRAWGQVQWAATLASLPILLWLFQQFSLVSPLANALAVPVVSFVITPLALLLAILPWPMLATLTYALLGGLMHFLLWCADWPLWQVAAPSWPAVAVGALGVVIGLLPRGLPGRGLGACLLLPALFWPAERLANGEARVDVLDVGQGLAVVVRTRQHVLIYDPGPQYGSEADAGQRVVLPFLRWLGVDRIDRLLITHRDTDHAGGAASLQAALPVGDLVTSARELGGAPCIDGQQWQWDGVDFLILHPSTSDYVQPTRTNQLSCVLRITAGGQRMLLTSDIEAPAEQALLARHGAALAADVLLVPHHGSHSSSTVDFLVAVGARHAVIPVGERNRFGHPAPVVLERLDAMPATVWRTDRQGAIRIALGGEPLVQISHWRAGRQRYWHRQ
ncbi:MAG: DNA internalization-related competence protein ComEC/Rec2, partial [Dechloromonas sp.]|nr:DNA internalization-related competence protein ComEC/Rec2 [Dechloromonas sp.]